MTNAINSGFGNYIGQVSTGASAGGMRGSSNGSGGSWYEAMSKAWGSTLDAQAAKITGLSDTIAAGGDQPSNMVQLTAESLRMQFISNNAATSQNAVGQALETLGKRQ